MGDRSKMALNPGQAGDTLVIDAVV